MGTVNDPHSDREQAAQEQESLDTAAPSPHLERAEYFAVLADSIQCAGPHPVRDADEIQKGMKVRKGAMLNVYTGFVPGMVVQDFGIHAMAHMAYLDHVNTKLQEAQQDPLTVAEQDMLSEFVVSGFVDADAEKKVIIRPDRSADVLCDALTILEQAGIHESDIQFIGKSKDNIDKLKEMGVLHLVDVLRPRTVEALTRSVREALVETQVGNHFYYNRERGERLITPTTFEELLSVASEPEGLSKRLEEICRLAAQQSITAKGNDVAFLTLSEDGKRTQVDDSLQEALGIVQAYVQDGLSAWDADKAEEVSTLIRDVARLQREQLPALFHHDAILNPQWVHAMEHVLNNRGESRQVIEMPERLGHAWSVIPGAYQGYWNHAGRMETGSRLLAEDNKEHVRLPVNKDFAIQFHDDGIEVLTREERGIRQSSWRFRDGISNETKALYGWLLEKHPHTAYAYVVSLDTSCDSSVSVTGEDDYVLVFGSRIHEEHRLYVRPIIEVDAGASVSQLQQAEARSIAAKETLTTLLGAQVYAEELIYIPGDTGGHIVAATPLVEQPLLQERSPSDLQDVDEASAYFEYLGKTAAHAVLLARQSFGQTGELLPTTSSEDAIPTFAGVRSISGEVPTTEELERSLEKVAARIALDVFALTKNTGATPRIELQHVSSVFETAAREVQQRVYQDGDYLRESIRDILSEAGDEDLAMALQARLSVIESLDITDLRERLEVNVAKHLVTLNSLSRDIIWSDEGAQFLDSIRTLYTDAVHLLPEDLTAFQASLEQSAMIRGLRMHEAVEYVTISYVQQLCDASGIDIEELAGFVASLQEHRPQDTEEAFLKHLREQYPEHRLSASASHSLYSALLHPTFKG